jgi:D-3-phosphoglycerate dehydrogenase
MSRGVNHICQENESILMRVLISAPYFIPVFERFNDYFEQAGLAVDIAKVVERLSEAELLPYAGQIDGVISGDDRFTGAVLEAFSPRLKVISKWGTGIDSIDREAAERLGVQIFNTPDAFTDAVADSVMGYILAFARQIPWIDDKLKSGAWEKIPSVALHECTLGVIGVGRIGKTVLKRARAFEMTLLGNDIVEIDRSFLDGCGVEVLNLFDLLERSDFVSVNCDLNPTSRHLINHEALARMKNSAILINTARGPIVDEDALIRALQAGQITGAGLDVFEDEPLPTDSPLRSMSSVLLGSHNANSSPSAWERVHKNTLKNLFVGLGLKPPAL